MSTCMDIKKELHLIITALETSKWTVNFNYQKTITKFLKIISLIKKQAVADRSMVV